MYSVITFAQQHLHFPVFFYLYFPMRIVSHLSVSVFPGAECDQRINSALCSTTSHVEWMNIKTYCTVSVSQKLQMHTEINPKILWMKEVYCRKKKDTRSLYDSSSGDLGFLHQT